MATHSSDTNKQALPIAGSPLSSILSHSLSLCVYRDDRMKRQREMLERGRRLLLG
jgi:hypothetical protein